MRSSENLTDEQLITEFAGGDSSACEELLLRYKNTVLSVARGYFLVGGDTEDLVQEGMCGLYSAITSFNAETPFAPYAYACIKNRILDAVKRCGAKNLTEVALVPFSEEGEGGAAIAFNPEDALIGSEDSREFSKKMKSALSPLEYSVLSMYIYGATLQEISEKFNLTYKQTDNALARSKNKIKKLISVKK